jgi:predicted dehydrogenase
VTVGEPVRAAVVGAGPVGMIHAEALLRHPRVELVGVVGRTAPKTEALARRVAVAAHRSVEALLAAERPDLVSVCTGNGDHLEPVLAALAGGAHVFVEKPIAFRLGDARAMVAAATAADRSLGVNLNHRFSAPYRRALAFVDAGRIGTPAYVAVKMAGDLYKDLNDPYCQLIETQGHSFDLVRRFAGEVVAVQAFLADPRRLGVFTSAAVTLELASGAVGTVLGSWDSSYRHPAAQTFELSGTDGRVVVENVVDAVRLFDHASGGYEEYRPGLFDSAARDFWRTIDAHLHAFVDAVVAGAAPPVSGADGLRALELSYAAARSHEERAVVTV